MIVVVGGFVSIILHNLISELMRVEEAFFLVLVIFALPSYLIIAAIFSLIHKFKDKNNDNS